MKATGTCGGSTIGGGGDPKEISRIWYPRGDRWKSIGKDGE
jgi:hypothetical protein